MPLANGFLNYDQISSEEPLYPLDVYFCSICSLVQITDVVPPEVMFTDYPYVTGTSQTMKYNLFELYERASYSIAQRENDLVIDVGSNDGTLLSYFKSGGFRTLGIEPASNIAELASEKGIETIETFFTNDTCSQILKTYGKAKIITGTTSMVKINQPGRSNWTKEIIGL